MLHVRIVASLLLLAAPLVAQDVLDTFSGSGNFGLWTYGPIPPPAPEPTGGNPNGWIHVTGQSLEPMLSSIGLGHDPFLGDWRAMGVRSVGVDLIVLHTLHPFFFHPCTLELSAPPYTIYDVGPELPQPGTGWKSFEFLLDPASTKMPPGWKVLGAGDPDETWNTVITNVQQVSFFYNDPTFLLTDNIWNTGADNARISSHPIWLDLRNALAGSFGTPSLAGTGQLADGSKLTLELEHALHFEPAALVIGLTELDLPFKGGLLVPAPDLLASFVTDSAGKVELSSHWPEGLPPGTSALLQFWIVDPGTPQGFSASNALKATSP